MFKKIVVIFLFVFSSLHFCSGQKKTTTDASILFRGVVIDASTLVRLGNSWIVINRSGSATSTEDGTFSFYAYKNDTIIFSLLGYKPVSLIVSDTLSGKEFLTGVYLETDTMQIGEVIIVPKVPNLKAELMNPTITVDPQLENARTNLANASYAARTNPAKLGNPDANYEFLRQKQKQDAYEKGSIPSDKIVGLSPLLLIPAAYLLIHGLPEKPPPPKPQISSKELNELQKIFLNSGRKK
jgi:hypothetical protein